MNLRHAVPAILIVVAFVVPAVSADYVYFAGQPMSCTMATVSYPDQQFSVYAYVVESGGVSGVSFRLDTDRFGPEHVQSVTPADGVTIDSGNIFDGISLSFDARELDHEPILHVVVSGHTTHGYVWTRSVEVRRRGGDKQAVDDLMTIAYNFDCLGTTPVWETPDTVEATVGLDEALTFRAGLKTANADAEVRVVDAAGWVAGGTYAVGVVCEWCPWSWTTVDVPVAVPAGIANGTLSQVTLEMYSLGSSVEQRTVVLRAVTTVTVEESTWSRIKALYR